MYKELINEIFDNFANTLSSRNRFLAEDGLRYIFFSEMLNIDGNTNNYILEQPYDVSITKYSSLFKSNIKNISQELDLLYSGDNEKIAFEFKYYKSNQLNDGKKNGGETKRCGAVFSDILRLNLIDKVDNRFLVYATESEMFNYKSINKLYDDLLSNDNLSFDLNDLKVFSKTFYDVAFKSFSKYPQSKTKININKCYSKQISINGKETYIFVFEIK